MVNSFKFGFVKNLSSVPLLINDRIFNNRNMGYSDLGRTENPLQELVSKDKVYLKDDLGVLKTFSHIFRLEFNKIPFFDEMQLKPTWYTEFLYYPKDESLNFIESLTKYTRISHGFGLSYSLSPIFSIMIYFNVGNFNALPGDNPLSGGISMTFNLL